MLITKEQQEALVDLYIKEKHNQDECIGFIDGINRTLELVNKIAFNTPVMRSDCFHPPQFRCYVSDTKFNCTQCGDFVG